MFRERANFLVIIFGMVVLLVILFAGYFWWQGQKPKDETANWKTYVSKDNLFTFKFPADWAVEPSQTFDSQSVTEFKFQNNPLFTVSLIGNYDQLNEYLAVRALKPKDLILDGQQAKRVSDPGEPGHIIPYEEVVVFTPNKKLIVSLYFKPDYYPQARENKTFDQILSSFKFL